MNFDCLAEICYKPLGDRGEDAYAFHFLRGDMQTIAVFDGCGGSGAWKYPEYKNATGAFVAAQSIAKTYISWFESLSPADGLNASSLAESFTEASRQVLQDIKRSCAPMGISGTLVKAFPCTASAALIIPNQEDGSLTLTTLNAGDSRVYVLTPGSGLIQLTADDSRGKPDALASLWQNAPLSNMLNADKPYHVSSRQVRLYGPCAVLCATDGVFGFVRSPMDFEYMLLKNILSANSAAEFEAGFQADIKEITGDDSTCLMAFYGWNSFSNIKSMMEKRFQYLENIIRTLNSAATPPEEIAAIRAQWEQYKKETVYDELQVQGTWNKSAFISS